MEFPQFRATVANCVSLHCLRSVTAIAGQPAPGHSKRTLERKQAQIDQMNRDLKRQKNSRTSESKVNALQLKISKLEAEIASESTAPVQSSAAEDASDDALRLCLEARASPAASLLANDTEWLLATPAVQQAIQEAAELARQTASQLHSTTHAEVTSWHLANRICVGLDLAHTAGIDCLVWPDWV